MPEKETLFLTVNETLEAVRIAFSQYPFKLDFLSVIWPLVFGNEAYVQQDASTRSVWVKIPGTNKLIPSNEKDLKKRIVDQMQCSIPVPEKLAEICEMIFGARVSATYKKNERSPAGIFIETDMVGFLCAQCGHCCRTLSIRDGCTPSDYQSWKTSGRTDILERVGIVSENGRVVAYRLWMVPGTNTYSNTCPWLEKESDQGRCACSIYDLRPTVCRQYPGSRKHARLTGCKGVFK